MHHHCGDTRTVRTERQAHADFARTLLHPMGHESIDSDRGQTKCAHAERRVPSDDLADDDQRRHSCLQHV